ncbi:hypothetical protein [Spirillospora sp. NPDC047279]|uniref:hypothetical protein n=1 Tax=Spirillospora sp. NPDC047279 TaxID=3155478 RepID=UPI0033C6900F
MKLRPSVVRRLACVTAAATLALVPLTAVAADAPPPSKVLSNYETSTGTAVSRDCGYSTRAPGSSTQALWIFCDTTWNAGFWLGVTAAIGPFTAGQVPTGLTEIPTPTAPINAPSNRGPSGLLPVPSGIVLPNGQNCQVPGSSYPASWASGVARQPSGSRVLIPYADVCVHGGGITTERFGLVEYNPSTNTLSGQRQVFSSTAQLPFQRILGSPIFSGGYLYLFGFECTSQAFGACGAGNVTLARVAANATAWGTASSYRYWTGSAWSSSHTAAASILSGAKPLAIHAENFGALGKGFVIVEQIDIAGNFRVWRSSSLTSGWSVTRTGQAPCSGQAGLDLCRAYFGHPALSTSANLLMSYYDPGNDHVNVMAVPW